MRKVNLNLPEFLHQKLEEKARSAGVSLEQLIVNLLARQLAEDKLMAAPEHAGAAQRAQYRKLLDALARASHEDIRRALEEREPTEPEVGLTAEIVAKVQNRLDRRA